FFPHHSFPPFLILTFISIQPTWAMENCDDCVGVRAFGTGNITRFDGFPICFRFLFPGSDSVCIRRSLVRAPSAPAKARG
ncbi:hypothetical protein B0I37DRAFT_371578, partial [Chaetomium sp. MPI-CAGE-AT-0009]